MKVKLFVMRLVEEEVEIDDKFRKLAVSRPWEDKTIPENMYEECTKAVEQVSGMPLGDTIETENGPDYPDSYIIAVHSAENGEIMLEW